MTKETKKQSSVWAKPSDKEVIQAAADAVGESLSEFVISASLDRAKKVARGVTR